MYKLKNTIYIYQVCKHRYLLLLYVRWFAEMFLSFHNFFKIIFIYNLKGKTFLQTLYILYVFNSSFKKHQIRKYSYQLP